MNLKQLLARWNLKDMLELTIAYLMLGTFLGYVFFYHIFYYLSAPFNSQVSLLVIVTLYAIAGFIIGYLFPDIRMVIASSVILPILGAIFCFILSISPSLSPDIISSSLSDDIFILARVLIGAVFSAFIIIFLTGFTMHMLDDEFGNEEAFGDNAE